MTIEVELPDGSIAEFPDGTPPDVIKGALAKKFPKGSAAKPEGPRGPDGMTTAERIAAAKAGTLKISPEAAGRQAMIDSLAENNVTQGKTGAFLGNVAQGMTFGFADEISGAMGGNTEALRMKREMDEQSYPKTTTVADVTGAIAGSVPLAVASAPAVTALAPAGLATRVAAGATLGGAVGAVEGGLSGAGYADGDDVWKATKAGAKVGAFFGGVFGAGAPLAGAGIKKVAEWVSGKDTRIISRVLGVDRKTAEVIKDGLATDDPAKAIAVMSRAGDDAMLADSGKGMSALLDSSMQFNPKAARIASERIEGRAANAAKRLTAVFDDVLGQADEGIKTAAKSIAARTAKVRETAYERAFSKPINYASDAGRAIDDVVARVPSDMMGKAIKVANDAMKIEGRTAKQIMASIADDGTVTFTKPLDIFQLNELKKALGEAGRGAVDQFGRLTGEGRRIKGLEVDLAKALGEAVPEYKAAVKLGGDKIAEDMALDLGRKMLSPNVTREQVIEGMRGASKDAVAAAKRGLRNFIDEKMASVKAVISDPNVDAREAMAMVKDMSSKSARQKAVALMGSKSADRLFDALDEATAHLELRAATARNSATAGRLAIKEGVERVVGDTTMDAVRDGRAVNAAQRIVQALTGGSAGRKTAAQQKIYSEIADALTRIQGPEAKRAMEVITRAIDGQPIKNEEAEAIARLLSTGGALVGYQTETRPRLASQGEQ